MKLFKLDELPNLSKGEILVFRWNVDGALYYKNSKEELLRINNKDGVYYIENIYGSLNIDSIIDWTGEKIIILSKTLQEILFRILTIKEIITTRGGGGSRTITKEIIYQPAPGDSYDYSSDINELQLELKTSGLEKYEEFIYSGEQLTQLDIWDSPAKTTKIYQVDYTYSGLSLTNIRVERIIDGFAYNKQFTYVDGTLVGINIEKEN